MLKILHSSDWHLGKNLGNFSRLEEQEEFLEEFLKICNEKKPHLVLIAGDIYDNFNPSAKAQELFYKYLKKFTNSGERIAIVIAGNHDSPERMDAPYPIAMETGILLSGYPETDLGNFSLNSGITIESISKGLIRIQFPDLDEKVCVLVTPYANESRILEYKKAEEDKEVSKILEEYWRKKIFELKHINSIQILIAHLFVMKRNGEKPEESEDEKSILSIGGAEIVYSDQFPNGLSYVALGHLHKFQVIEKEPFPVVYSGSPLAYSVKEDNQKKYVVYAEINKTKTQIFPIELKCGKKIYRKEFSNPEDAIAWLKQNPNCYVEISLETEEYLSSEDHRKIREAHSGIVQIIPKIKNLFNKNTVKINLDQSLENLFSDYFFHKYKQKPSQEILEEFQEILNLEIEN